MHGAALAHSASRRLQRAIGGPWFWLLATLPLAVLSIEQVRSSTGGPLVAPLDDAYIHFQFARSFARGTPFVYSEGAPPVAGATSLLWPLLLALPERLGGPPATIACALFVSWVAFGLLAYEAVKSSQALLTERLAPVSGVLVLALSAHAWFATSGMEVLPLAWLLLRLTRRSAEWLEGRQVRAGELILLALLAPALRPEGVLVTVLAAAALAYRPRGRPRAWALLALASALLPSLVCWLATGRLAQTTARAKWLPLSPYATFDGLYDRISDNCLLVFGTLLDGRIWSWIFIPEHSRSVAILALPALLALGFHRRARARGLLLTALGLGLLVPASYDCMLCNRLRYLWPFATPWLIGVLALAEWLGIAAARLEPRLRGLRFVAGAGAAIALSRLYPFALGDLGESAHAIQSQHLALADWARRTLPHGARIAVNDTGALAYFSGHPTFDIVGLTTDGEARYWAAGTGSRFEHYERLGAGALPPYFIVYPNWLGIPELLGACPEARTVHATILGGDTMLACHADYSLLGSGEHPLSPELRRRTEIDRLDVADLESERGHAYALMPASQAANLVVTDGQALDGARTRRVRDCFELGLVPGASLVARLGADEPDTLGVRVDQRPVGSFSVAPGEFEERSLTLPADLRPGRHRICVVAERSHFSSAHYWVLAPAS